MDNKLKYTEIARWDKFQDTEVKAHEEYRDSTGKTLINSYGKTLEGRRVSEILEYLKSFDRNDFVCLETDYDSDFVVPTVYKISEFSEEDIKILDRQLLESKNRDKKYRFEQFLKLKKEFETDENVCEPDK